MAGPSDVEDDRTDRGRRRGLKGQSGSSVRSGERQNRDHSSGGGQRRRRRWRRVVEEEAEEQQRLQRLSWFGDSGLCFRVFVFFFSDFNFCRFDVSSAEKDGRMEMPETSRLRDRGLKKDRDRDRSGRSKRRRGDRLLHGSNRDRDDAEESSEESIDQDEDDEDEDLSVPVRLPPSSPPLLNPLAASSPQQNNHHHQHQQLSRKTFPPKKPISGTKHRPPKISKSASLSQDEIEIEVAEVLYGMTRQFESLPQQDSHKLDARDVDGGLGNETKSRVSSPSSMSPSPAALPSANLYSVPTPLPTIAPKRKRPRPVKFDEEGPTSPVPSIAKMDSDNQIKTEASSPRSEKNVAFNALKNGGGSIDVLASQDGLSVVQQQESAKKEKIKIQDLHPLTAVSNNGGKMENKQELVSPVKGLARTDLDATSTKIYSQSYRSLDSLKEKLKIDLMASKVNKDKAEAKPAESTLMRDEQQIEKSAQKDIDPKKQVVITQNLDLQVDLGKAKKDDSGFDKVRIHRQQVKDSKVEPKQEKSAGATPLYGAKPYNPNMVPSSDAAIPLNPMQGSFPGANMGALQDTKGTPELTSYMGNISQEKMQIMDTAQRKPLILQQMPQSGSANNTPGLRRFEEQVILKQCPSSTLLTCFTHHKYDRNSSNQQGHCLMFNRVTRVQ
ncbi:hypothetical protein BHM03_00036847 [Ensete ventricosum]|nr:hypothetical protein BHM03_00036847 [Ensete ventricosum]